MQKYDRKEIEKKWRKVWNSDLTLPSPLKGEGSSNAPLKGEGSSNAPLKGEGSSNAPLKGEGNSAHPCPSQEGNAPTPACGHPSREGTYTTKDDPTKPKYYVLDMFPYPSGAGLHVGHPKGYIATDVVARMKMMQGFNVLHPMGWDAFGLPAENFALKNKVHPRAATEQNVATFKEQLSKLGFSYDWEREINTTDPEFYKWTQWIFLEMFKRGLAYESYEPIIWCPSCKTGLAMEDLEGGKCERCGSDVERKPMRQWVLKITDYADRLLDDIDKLTEWESSIKEMQRNWIGKSEGAEVEFGIRRDTDPRINADAADMQINANTKIKVFTTRPDTLFGATYMVVAPEHLLVANCKSQITNIKEVEVYVEQAKKKSELERSELQKEKTGVELKGIKAINPVNGEEIPVFVADYVLSGYGTGAIMAVPAHDERDWEFAKKYGLKIKPVVFPENQEILMSPSSDKSRAFEIAVSLVSKSIEEQGAIVMEGININSSFLDGMQTKEAKEKMIEWLEAEGSGQWAVNFKLKDWVFSRQRYWGEPIPLVHCEKCGVVAVPESELPVMLPEVEHYEPTGTGESPLANITDWVNTTCPKCGGPAKRETNTMPQWAGSSWYYLRYIDPKNSEALVDKDKEKYWSPVDLYVGGAEHATRHLIYARFWHKFLFDIGAVAHDEPFTRLQHVGLILAEDGRKMSKRWGNVINPDEIVEKYGADAMRVYEMFMGPFAQACAWNTNGLIGARRFLERIYKMKDKIRKRGAGSRELGVGITTHFSPLTTHHLLHKTVKKVTEDIAEFKFNTAVAALMILVNEMEKEEEISIEQYTTLIKLLAPFAPHLCEEIYAEIRDQGEGSGELEIPTHDSRLATHITSIFDEAWPDYDPSLVIDDTIELVLQVNGKVRDRVSALADISEEDAKKLALESEIIKKWLEGQEPKKVVYVKGKLVNIVI